MPKKASVYIMLVLVSFGFTACSFLPEKHPDKIELSDGLKKTMGEYGAKMAVVVTEDGKIIPTDNQGKVLARCSIKPGNDGAPACRGLQKGAAIEEVKSITLIRSKINPWCDIIRDPYNFAYEICW